MGSLFHGTPERRKVLTGFMLIHWKISTTDGSNGTPEMWPLNQLYILYGKNSRKRKHLCICECDHHKTLAAKFFTDIICPFFKIECSHFRTSMQFPWRNTALSKTHKIWPNFDGLYNFYQKLKWNFLGNGQNKFKVLRNMFLFYFYHAFKYSGIYFPTR